MKMASNEILWKKLYPFMFPESCFRTAKEEVAAIMGITGLRSGRVLDLACGPGRHAVPLAMKGFRVTGVDRSPFLLGNARQYAERLRLSLEWVQEDMRFFSRPESFHLALSLYSSFGYFDDPRENQMVLKNIHRSLAVGGVLIMDLPGREVLARDFRKGVHFEVPEIGYIAEYRTVTGDWKRLSLKWEFTERNRLRHLSFKLWLYSGHELRNMLIEAGFCSVRLYGGFDGRDYDGQARQLIAYAVKESNGTRVSTKGG